MSRRDTLTVSRRDTLTAVPPTSTTMDQRRSQPPPLFWCHLAHNRSGGRCFIPRLGRRHPQAELKDRDRSLGKAKHVPDLEGAEGLVAQVSI